MDAINIVASVCSLLTVIHLPNEIYGFEDETLYAIRWDRLGYEWLMTIKIHQSGKSEGWYRVLSYDRTQMLVNQEMSFDKPPFATLFHKVLPSASYGRYASRFEEPTGFEQTASFARGYILMARFLISSASDSDLLAELEHFSVEKCGSTRL